MMELTGRPLTFLQREVLEEARKADLPEAQLKLFANGTLNYLQMEAVRNALEEGMDPQCVKRFAKPWIRADEMNEIRDAIRSGEEPVIPKCPFVFPKGILFGSLVLILFGLAAGLAMMEPERAVLELTNDEIRLSCGMKFEPSNYVRTVQGEQAELILPESFAAERPGVRLVSYELKGRSGSIRKLLRIVIADETPPVITLIQNHAELLRVTPFSCRMYLKSAEDNVDGDLSAKVSCSDELSEDETQTVLYTVTDKAGNTAEETLEIHFASLPSKTDPPKPSASPVKTEPPVEREVTEPVPEAAPVYDAAPFEPVSEIRTEVIEYSETASQTDSGTVVEHSLG